MDILSSCHSLSIARDDGKDKFSLNQLQRNSVHSAIVVGGEVGRLGEGGGVGNDPGEGDRRKKITQNNRLLNAMMPKGNA